MPARKLTKRLDELVLERGLAATPAEAKALIMSGRVFVDGAPSDKPGTAIQVDLPVTMIEKRPFASRGGVKLAGALKRFSVSVENKICADVGSSTGGFTDVLLKSGAAKVYAIDSAYGELDWSLRSHERVVTMERTNATTIQKLPEPIDFVSIDVSLLPLRKIVPTVLQWLSAEASVIALIKPQYEADRSELPKGAVITAPEVHRAIISRVISELEGLSCSVSGIMASPILGTGGNREFLVWFNKCGRAPLIGDSLAAAIDRVMRGFQVPLESALS